MFESVDSLSQGDEATHIPILVYKFHSYVCLKDGAKIKDECPFHEYPAVVIFIPQQGYFELERYFIILCDVFPIK